MPKKEDKKKVVKKVVKKPTSKKTVKKTSDSKKTVKKVSKKTSSNKQVKSKSTTVTKKKTATKSNKKPASKKVVKKIDSSKPKQKKTKKKTIKQENVVENVLSAGDLFPTDIAYGALPEGYEPEIRVTEDIDKINNNGFSLFIKLTISIISLILISFLGIRLFTLITDSKTTLYDLSNINSVLIETGKVIRVPSTWVVTNEGKAYEKDSKDIKMAIYIQYSTPSEFEKTVEKLGATYVTTSTDLDGGTLYYIDNIYDSQDINDEVDYFFYYKDNVLYQFVFSKCDFKTEINIIESIK